MNHFKDEAEDFEKTKLLCRFLNPMAAQTLFDKKTVDVTVSTESVMFDKMAQDLGGKYTPQELEAIMKDPKHYAELDVIERA
jgi:hypothetical protein